MNTYRLTNRLTRETCIVDAENAQAACAQMGWMIGNTHVLPVTPIEYPPVNRDYPLPPDRVTGERSGG